MVAHSEKEMPRESSTLPHYFPGHHKLKGDSRSRLCSNHALGEQSKFSASQIMGVGAEPQVRSPKGVKCFFPSGPNRKRSLMEDNSSWLPSPKSSRRGEKELERKEKKETNKKN